MGNFNSFLHWMLNYFIIVLVSLVIIDFCCCFLLKTNFLTNFSNTLKYSLKNVVIILVLSKIITSLKIYHQIFIFYVFVFDDYWVELLWNMLLISLLLNYLKISKKVIIMLLSTIYEFFFIVGRNISLKASNLGCTWYEWHQSDYWQSSKAF